jgi:hypothetical protein
MLDRRRYSCWPSEREGRDPFIRGFRGTPPNPRQERKVTNFYRNLARYTGTGSPRVLK